jgi:hypothetical protein
LALAVSNLTPILVAGYGRSGTTALMALLGSDPRVAFDRRYPYENRYLTYLTKFALVTGRPSPGPRFTGEQLYNYADSQFGGYPWPDPGPNDPPPLGPSPADWLSGLWEAFSRSARARNPGLTHYAEKTAEWLPAAVADVLPARIIHLTRDPRDVFLSVFAFAKARGVPGFGPDSGPDHARNLAHDLLLYSENARSCADGVPVRYEDLVADGDALASRLSSAFGLELSAEGVRSRIPAHHRTTPDTAASVGRWRREPLPKGVAPLLESLLYDSMKETGYDLSRGAAPASGMAFGPMLAGGRTPATSAHGKLGPGPDGAAATLTGPDFWVELPPEKMDAAAAREVWVCLRGRTGTHCSLYWRHRRDRFGEERALHVPFVPGPHWQIARFRVADHPLWRNSVHQLRLDPFNGTTAPAAGGDLRWLRLVP